jgi:hypothetical protein
MVVERESAQVARDRSQVEREDAQLVRDCVQEERKGARVVRDRAHVMWENARVCKERSRAARQCTCKPAGRFVESGGAHRERVQAVQGGKDPGHGMLGGR